MILDQIIANKIRQLELEKNLMPLDELRQKCAFTKNIPVRDFSGAIKKAAGLAIIAEVKQASPSKGVIKADFNHLAIAKEYVANHVAAISVLTEQKYFRGSDLYLKEIREHVDLPLLQKDFVVDPYQVYQGRYLGADCILLIVAALGFKQLQELYQLATDLSLQCLVEVHNQKELELALKLDAHLIGINNRNLKTFETDLSTTTQLFRHIPDSKIVVSESGINSRSDMDYLESLGVSGVLIGSSLMEADSITRKLGELRGGRCGQG